MQEVINKMSSELLSKIQLGKISIKKKIRERKNQRNKITKINYKTKLKENKK